MIRAMRYLFLLLPLLLQLCNLALGQQSATVSGSVLDLKGASMPGVQVSLKNPSIDFERQVVTGPDGRYTFTDVVPLAGYVLTAVSPGHQFKPLAFDLQVNQYFTQLPPISEEPLATTPTAATPTPVAPKPIALDSLSTSIGTVITRADLEALPLYNRNFLTLGLLGVDVHNVPAGSPLAGATFSISGARPTSNNFLLDGMDNVASSTNQAIPFQVNDAIQEFRVVASTPDAQFGRNVGGVVNIVTHRATTDFHGSVFGFFGSDSLNAANPLSVYSNSGFAQAAAYANSSVPILTNSVTNSQGPLTLLSPIAYNQLVTASPGCSTGGTEPVGCSNFNPSAILAANNSFTQPFSSQQFGGNAGFSLFKTRKLFVFGDYEGTRINNPNPIFDRVPNALDLAPATSGPDTSLAQAILKLYPAANVTTNGQAGALAFFKGQAPNYTNVDNYMVRLDWNQSKNSNWVARYNAQDLHQLHDDQLPSGGVYRGDGAYRSALNQSAMLSFVHVFSPTLTNEARGGFTRFQVIETPQDQGSSVVSGFSGKSIPTFVLAGLDPRYFGATSAGSIANTYTGWNNAYWNAPAFSTNLTPSLDGFFPFPRIGAPLYAPGQNRDTMGYIADNLSWVHGAHSIRFGVEYRKLQNIFINDAFARGYVASGDIGEFTSDSETGNFGLANTNNGAPYGSAPSFDFSVKQNLPYRTLFNSYALAGYAQDSWRVTNRLTINAGLRFAYYSDPTETNNQIWNYNQVANGLIQQANNKVFDTFGYQCGVNVVNGVQFGVLNSVYPSRTAQLPWKCQANASNNLFNNFLGGLEPRVGVAWSNADGTMVIRGGYGLFRDQLPMSSIAPLMFNRPTPLNITNPQALYGQSFTSAYCPGQCGMGNTSLLSLNPNAAGSQIASIPFGVTALAPNFSLPYSQQANFSLQRLLSPTLSMELGYVGQFGSNVTTTTNTGYNNEWWCTSSAGAPNPVPNTQFTPKCDTFSYLPAFTIADNGRSNFNSLIARVHMNQWHGLQLSASYVWSKSLDNASAINTPLVPAALMTEFYALQFFGLGNPTFFGLGKQQNGRLTSSTSPGLCTQCGGVAFATPPSLGALVGSALTTTGAGQVYVSPYTIPQDPYNSLVNDYGPSDFNITNRFVLDYAWNLPFKSTSRYLGGWTVTGIVIAESGQPYTIFSGPVFGELTQRVNVTGPVVTTGNPNSYILDNNIISPGFRNGGCNSTVNSPYVTGPELFSGKAGSPCLGNTGRNAFTGPAYFTFDMAVQKAFKVFSERNTLILRSEFYNLFNRANYYNPISVYSLDGVTINPQFGEIKSAHEPRQIQLAVRFSW